MKGRIIGIDYGKNRTGIAVTDLLQMIASPLQTVPTAELMQFLQNYIQREPVTTFVVGEPRQMNNTDSSIGEEIHTFAKALKIKFPEIRVERIDERFTSKMAIRSILESGAKKRTRRDKSIIDRVSATLILQSYLNSF